MLVPYNCFYNYKISLHAMIIMSMRTSTVAWHLLLAYYLIGYMTNIPLIVQNSYDFCSTSPPLTFYVAKLHVCVCVCYLVIMSYASKLVPWNYLYNYKISFNSMMLMSIGVSTMGRHLLLFYYLIGCRIDMTYVHPPLVHPLYLTFMGMC